MHDVWCVLGNGIKLWSERLDMLCHFDPLEVELKGVNLVEASAGTGKTWNIAAIFLRFILLEKLRVDEVLVVTFTKPATAELKSRLYERLESVLLILEEESVMQAVGVQAQLEQIASLLEDKDKGLILTLLEKALQEEELLRLILRLRSALSDFDHAAIYTIHGFCQKVLGEFAFYCQSSFDIELDAVKAREQQVLAVQDFWRKNVATNRVLSELVLSAKQNPHDQLTCLQNYIARPYLVLPSLTQAEKELEQITQDLRLQWRGLQLELDELERAFWVLFPSLSGRSYNKDKWLSHFEMLKKLPENDCISVWKNLVNSSGQAALSVEVLKSKKKKNAELDEQALMQVGRLGVWTEACIELQKKQKCALIDLNLSLLRYLREANELVKKQTPIRQFDDLLLDVYLALQEGQTQAEELAQAMAQVWKVALIDEFQDTDPLQYAIFQAAFVKTQTPLFLVGDPKQAIYSFRGADIFAYLQAVEDATKTKNSIFTLSVNRRSHQKLVQAVNAVFARSNPFVLPQIQYPAVEAAREESRLLCNGKTVKSLAVRWIADEEDKTVDVLRTKSAQWCAKEIVHLLSQHNAYTLGEQPIQTQDIAVLVRTHKEAALIQAELKKCSIQSVFLSRENIFSSPEAEILATLLLYFQETQRVDLLRFILSSHWLDYKADDIYALNEDESRLLHWIEAAEAAMNTWQKHGVYAALHQFLVREKIESHLLSQHNERALTNIHQLLELLAAEDENGHTPTSLLQWLKTQIALSQQSGENETQALRLESDEQLVKIVTMHASKGLQYPIVLCPFMWSENIKNEKWEVVHQNQEALLLHESQLDEEQKSLLRNEKLSENLRLFYVALTRAEERLIIYMASYQVENNPFAYLLNVQKEESSKEKSSKEEPSDLYLEAWKNFIAQHADLMEWLPNDECNDGHYEPNETKSTIFQAACFTERRFDWIRQSSFTGLLRQHERQKVQVDEIQPALDLSEHSEVVLPETEPELLEQTDSLFFFPSGPKAGVCLHDILEKTDFSQPANMQTELIQTVLTQHQLDAQQWLPAMEGMIEAVRYTPLLPNIVLSQLPNQSMQSEMEFLLHSDRIALLKLKRWFAQKHLGLSSLLMQAAQTLNFSDIRGFLNGFIDLVCYTPNGQAIVIDYKSNHLGYDIADYSQAAMDQVVAENHYYLQAFIYALAVARYLKQRQIQTESIQICYLFLRGLDGMSQNGVWSWNIKISDLEEWLA